MEASTTLLLTGRELICEAVGPAQVREPSWSSASVLGMVCSGGPFFVPRLLELTPVWRHRWIVCSDSRPSRHQTAQDFVSFSTSQDSFKHLEVPIFSFSFHHLYSCVGSSRRLGLGMK